MNKINHIELMPCPFCGGEAEIFLRKTMVGIGCIHSCAEMCGSFNEDDDESHIASSKQYAIDAWNERALKYNKNNDDIMRVLNDLSQSAENMNVWLKNWDLPFHDEDEWSVDKVLFEKNLETAQIFLGRKKETGDG